MHKPESNLENESHQILRDLQIQTGHPTPARRPHSVIINKKKKRKKKGRTRQIMEFIVPGGPLTENLRKRKERQVVRLDLARELKKITIDNN